MVCRNAAMLEFRRLNNVVQKLTETEVQTNCNKVRRNLVATVKETFKSVYFTTVIVKSKVANLRTQCTLESES